VDDLDADAVPVAMTWPAEDGGGRRIALAEGGLGGALHTTAVRDAVGTTMVVLGASGEVYVLRHTLGRRPLEDTVVAWVERIDPVTLEPVARSGDLPAGPFWPGGMAVHADGSLHVVMGTWCHRLSPDLDVLASLRLPGERPYNSFVTLADGTLAMKDFDRAGVVPATLVFLDPETLARRAPDVALPEASIARLSADDEHLYVVGVRSSMRLRDGVLDDEWRLEYLQPGGSYGWDPVVAGGQLWFMDNGAHDFVTTMRGAGVAPGPVHLVRVSLADAADHEIVEVCGLPRGAVTDPPLYDEARGIAIAYDSANGVVQAFRFDGSLTPLWRRGLSHAAHMILFGATGELVLHDYRGPAWQRTRAGRAIGRRSTATLRHAHLRRLASRLSRDEVVVVDIETGEERGRAPVPTLMQSVVFPAPGFDRDVYWCTMTTIARVVAA
jgi:hypothetical protein